MRYMLWSNGILLGYTALDIYTVSAGMRQGFIEPTPEGEPLLRDATGVPRAIAEERRRRRERGGGRLDLEGFQAACERREALNLELRDESGTTFECDFMRVYDLRDAEAALDNDYDEEDDPQLLEGSDVEADELDDADELDLRGDDADFEAAVMEWKQDAEDEEMYKSTWPPPPPPDERWNTMRYQLQVHLKGAMELDGWFFDSEFD